MDLDYLLYASRLEEPMGYDALKRLLDVSQRNNAQSGLTGFLHIEGRVVLQYLEGPAGGLRSTIQRIQRDPRHSDFSILAEGHLEQRNFDGWKMALVESTTLSLFDLIGAPCEDIPDIEKVNPTDIITLLSANSSYLRHQPSVVA
ncbi:MAG: BLUF domain-containing protein [Roseobacter sp.]|jgi:hypothetical protein|nr:BLUF domain-containing protein [Roseobacter sp.]